VKINLTVEVIPRLGREKKLKVTVSEDQTRGAGDPPPLREKRVKATDKIKLAVQVIPRL
jgi:hypothetical protein